MNTCTIRKYNLAESERTCYENNSNHYDLVLSYCTHFIEFSDFGLSRVIIKIVETKEIFMVQYNAQDDTLRSDKISEENAEQLLKLWNSHLN